MSRPDPSKISKEANRILTFDVNAVADVVSKQFPIPWARMFTKSIDAPGNYYSSKALAVSLTGSIEEAREQGKMESNTSAIAGILERYDFPTYYVSRPLAEALKHSAPPKGITWDDIMLPFQALVFMLPRGTLQEPSEVGGADVIYLGIAKLKKGEELNIPTVGRMVSTPEDRIDVFWCVAPSALVISDTTFPSSHPLIPIAEWIEEHTPSELKSRVEGGRAYCPPTTFSTYVTGLVANFILVMEARKELVEPGRLVQKAIRPGKPDRYLPTFIGRNYAILKKREGQAIDAKGHFTELGWRAGHFKRQHFGPKTDSQVKTIFVDPYIAFTRGLVPIEKV